MKHDQAEQQQRARIPAVYNRHGMVVMPNQNRMHSASTPTSLFRGLCNCCCCCPKQLRRTQVAPLPSGRPAFDDDSGSADYEMIETRPHRRIRVIHLLPQETLDKYKSGKMTTVNATNGSNGGCLEKNGNCAASFNQEVTSRRSTRSQCPAANALVVSVEINNGREVEEIEADSASIVDDNELAMEEAADGVESDLSRRRSVHVYDFESAFHPNNRSVHVVREEDKQHKLQVYSNCLAQSILTSVLQDIGNKSGETVASTVHASERIEFRNGQVAHFLNSSDVSSNLSLEDGRDRSYYNNLAFQELDALDGGVACEKSVSNATMNSNFTSSGFHSLSKRFIGLSSIESGVQAGDDLPHSANNLNPFENFTYSPSGCCDDASSQVGSSFQSSTWGSSTNSSLRYVRRFVSKKYKTKPMLFFIHGIGESADLWRNQLRFFRHKGYETLAMDLVGHGLSYAPDKPKVYLFHNILADVIAIFDRYSKERNVAVGHSYGACFAAALARHRSKQITHLILLSGGGPFPLCPQVTRKCVPFCFAGCVKWWDTSCKSKRRAYYMPSRKQTRFVSSLEIPSYVRRYIFKGQMWLEGDASFHKQITVPTLLVYGLRDPFITLVEECEMEKTIPRAFLELIPEAGHMLMLDTPHQVNDMIYKFLRRWDR